MLELGELVKKGSNPVKPAPIEACRKLLHLVPADVVSLQGHAIADVPCAGRKLGGKALFQDDRPDARGLLPDLLLITEIGEQHR